MQDYFLQHTQKMLRMYRCRNSSGGPAFSLNHIALQIHKNPHICMRISYRRWHDADND